MKTLLLIFSFVSLFSISSFAQDDEGASGAKVRERMQEYLQKRLNLSKTEAAKFGPVFLNYFNDLRKTNEDYKGDRLKLQQKIVDLRIKYRDQFKNIMGDKRSNDVFEYERDFVEEVRKIRMDRIQNQRDNRGGKKGLGGPLL